MKSARRASRGTCRRLFGLSLCLLGMLPLTPAAAGIYFSLGLKGGLMAPQALAEEATPNYYGGGPSLALGYSIKQVLDLGIYGGYSAGTREEPALRAADAELAIYGGDVGLRLGDTIYLGVHGGSSLLTVGKPSVDGEISGRWEGVGGGFCIAAIHKFNRERYFQTGVEFAHVVLDHVSDKSQPTRKIDAFAISLAYTYNSFSSNAVDNSILGDFVRSINFF